MFEIIFFIQKSSKTWKSPFGSASIVLDSMWCSRYQQLLLFVFFFSIFWKIMIFLAHFYFKSQFSLIFFQEGHENLPDLCTRFGDEYESKREKQRKLLQFCRMAQVCKQKMKEKLGKYDFSGFSEICKFLFFPIKFFFYLKSLRNWKNNKIQFFSIKKMYAD